MVYSLDGAPASWRAWSYTILSPARMPRRAAVPPASSSTPATGPGDGISRFECDNCAEDVTEDDLVDIDDLFEVLAHWGEGATAYDVNYDGVVSIDDVFAILAAWGPCP